eukprot:COSAG01_NODE_24058_length_792_cov_0.803752_1_plen_244_part_01
MYITGRKPHHSSVRIVSYFFQNFFLPVTYLQQSEFFTSQCDALLLGKVAAETEAAPAAVHLCMGGAYSSLGLRRKRPPGLQMFSGMLARRGGVPALLLPPTEARGLHASAALYSKASRKALTGKRANKNYYKGKGRSASTPHRPIGRRTKHGNYVIDAPRDAHRLYARTANGEEMWGVHADGHGHGDDAQITQVGEIYRVRLPEHDRQEDALAQAIFEHQLRVYMPEAYGRAAASRQLKAPVPS